MRDRRILGAGEAAGAPEQEAAAGATMESDMVVIMAAMLCGLICVVGLIAVARCACRRQRPIAHLNSSSNNTNTNTNNNKGLKKEAIHSLPTYTYDAAAISTSTCAICLGEFSAGEELRALPGCGHAFHLPCVEPWLSSHSSCPSCRRPVSRSHHCPPHPFPTPSFLP